MNVRRVPAHRLTADHVAAWDALQRADPELESPFFRPEFTRAVAAVRDDGEVGILIEAGEPVGFFPYQRRALGVAGPIGGRMSDFQGVVCRRGVAWDAGALLAGCRLRAWEFDHLLASQRPFRPYHHQTAGAPFLDLAHGYAAYETRRREAGSQELVRTHRKERKIEREVGPLRLEVRTTDARVLERLLLWKSDQYRRTGTTDITTVRWIRDLLARIVTADTDDFGGMLSALWVGDDLAAVHLAMRSGAVLHSWLPSYDRGLQRYSPGSILIRRLAEAAPALGIARLHLGKGPEDYKWRFTTDAVLVAEGSVARNPLSAALRRRLSDLRRFVMASHLRTPARAAARLVGRAVPALGERLKVR